MQFSKKKEEGMAANAVQLRNRERHPFGILDGYVPLQNGEVALYRAIREAVPVVDAAIYKIIRMVGGVRFPCDDRQAENALAEFMRSVNVGRGQCGINAFLECYLDSLLVCGRAVGEMIPTQDGRTLAALLCGRVEDMEIREGESPLDFQLCGTDEGGALTPLPQQKLLLFTPFNPETGSPYGVSLLRSMPFLTELLMKIYNTMGLNWERCGNLRFAVVYKPQGDGLSGQLAQERSEQIAREWSAAMQSGKSGNIRDFVAVGDVEIKVIGADNQILDSEVPVRQILEQIVAKTGIPPFMLGLNWSSTERMSSQQADLLTTEITAIRRSLTPMLERICRLFLRMHGWDCGFEVEWEDINLQDQVEEARALLYLEQARKLRLENDAAEGAAGPDGK